MNWGILGLGAIANEFATALTDAGMGIYAAASRTKEKASAFAKKYAIPHAFSSYDEMLSSPDVHVIYIATPHDSHYEWSKKALLNGKHVLCEKAACVNYSEFDELIRLAHERNLVFEEAMTIYHMPVFEKLRALVGENAPLGKVKTINVSFGSYKPYDPENRFFNPNLAGGAMLDIGVYALSFARFFMSCSPSTVLSHVLPAQSGVDEQSAIILNNAASELATVNIALRAKLPKCGIVACENGYISVDDYPRADSAKIVWTQDGKTETITAGSSTKALVYEAAYMNSRISGASHVSYTQLSLDVMRIMEDVLTAK